MMWRHSSYQGWREEISATATRDEAVSIVASLIRAGDDPNAELGELSTGEKIYDSYLLEAIALLPYSADIVRLLLKHDEVKVNQEERRTILEHAASLDTPPDVMEGLITHLMPLQLKDVLASLRRAVVMLRVDNVRLLLQETGFPPKQLVSTVIRSSKGPTKGKSAEGSTLLGYLLVSELKCKRPTKAEACHRHCQDLPSTGLTPPPPWQPLWVFRRRISLPSSCYTSRQELTALNSTKVSSWRYWTRSALM